MAYFQDESVISKVCILMVIDLWEQTMHTDCFSLGGFYISDFFLEKLTKTKSTAGSNRLFEFYPNAILKKLENHTTRAERFST